MWGTRSQFDQKGKERDVGCSLKGEKRFACLHPEEDLIMSSLSGKDGN